MAAYIVEGMKCGGCVSSMTNAINEIRQETEVDVDLASKTLSVPDECPQSVVQDAAAKAGFTFVGLA